MTLGARALAAYAAPAVALAALYFPVYVYVAPFYAGEHGVALGALGGLFIAVRLLDAVTDPAMGWLSDRTPARLGRRKLWMALSAPLVAVSVWMLLVPPPDAGFGHVGQVEQPNGFCLGEGWALLQYRHKVCLGLIQMSELCLDDSGKIDPLQAEQRGRFNERKDRGRLV